jgi:predicted 2-oxoglutarate/Fe(II)-dependent dioxygenase YbiX
LLRLFERSGLEVFDVAQQVCLLDQADAQTEAMLLPVAIGATYEPTVGYLKCSASGQERQAGYPMRVGACWSASRDDRSASVEALEPLRGVPGVEFVNLTHHAEPPPFIRSVPLGDFADTADIIGGLDLVISVDTVIAHLAGALGKPVWILLPLHADWRWQTGERSPWYRSARLYRGELDASCFERIADALANEVAPWAASEVVFCPTECARIREQLAELPVDRGRVASGVSPLFMAQQAMVHPTDQALWWVHERIAEAVERAGARLGIKGAAQAESGHYLRYGVGGKFDWNRDDYGEGKRVLSLTLQLSNPEDYAGGDLIINAPDGSRRVIGERTQGSITFFRSQCLHAVTPVTQGRTGFAGRLARAAVTVALVPVSIGELIDKITILQIKAERIGDATKRANVLRELDALQAVRDALVCPPSPPDLERDLVATNAARWDIEDRIRACERGRDFGAGFVKLARSVYQLNDQRAALKRQINVMTGSSIVEEKSYVREEGGLMGRTSIAGADALLAGPMVLGGGMAGG